MTQAHTPGPWTIPDWMQLGRIDVVATNGCKVAAVYLQADPTTVKGWPTEEANARLIAAAPDLLEASQGLLAHTYPINNKSLRGGKSALVYLEQLAAAVAKAEGQI
jgi:hypothetical protein